MAKSEQCEHLLKIIRVGNVKTYPQVIINGWLIYTSNTGITLLVNTNALAAHKDELVASIGKRLVVRWSTVVDVLGTHNALYILEVSRSV